MRVILVGPRQKFRVGLLFVSCFVDISRCVFRTPEVDVEEELRSPVTRARSEAPPTEERKVSFPARSRDRAYSRPPSPRRVRSEVHRPPREAAPELRDRTRRNGTAEFRRERSTSYRERSTSRRRRDLTAGTSRIRSSSRGRSPSPVEPGHARHLSKVLGWLSRVSDQREYSVFYFCLFCRFVTGLNYCSGAGDLSTRKDSGSLAPFGPLTDAALCSPWTSCLHPFTLS